MSALEPCSSERVKSDVPCHLPLTHSLHLHSGALLTSNSQASARHESRNDGVPRVFFLTNALDGAVVRAKHASPHAKVAAQHGRARLDRRHRSG